jgi:hypothetical protein
MLWHCNKTRFGHPGAGALFLGLVCLLLCGIHTPAQGSPCDVRERRMYTGDRDFAIADFDGDRRPDLASVEVQTHSSSGAIAYSIHFRLASGAGQAFGVIAPAGGLQLMARDVNGDNAPDILVRTAWQHRRVALFLNDGHGNFSPADPGAFPAAAQNDDVQWSDGQAPCHETTMLLRSQDSTSCLTVECAWNSPEPRNRFPLDRARYLSGRQAPRGPFGRAPPSFILPA